MTSLLRRAGLGRLGARLLLAFLAVALLPVSVVAATAWLDGRAVVGRFVADNTGRTARSWAADVDWFLDRQRALLRAVPLGNGVVDPTTLAGEDEGDPTLLSLILLDASGDLLAASVQPRSLDPWALDACQSLAAEPERTVAHAGEGHAHEVIVAVPREGDRVLCGQITFTPHQEMLTERARSTYGGVAYIVDRAGTVVCHAFHDDEPHAVRGSVLSGEASIAAAAGRPWTGVLGVPDDRRFAAYAPVRSLPWGVWVEVPVSVATAALQPFLRHTAIYGGLFALGVAFAALVLSRRLARPLRKLALAARRIAGGDYGETVTIEGEDEVAQVAAEFNSMSRALAASYSELDARVEQRTAELRAVQARLVHQEKMAALGTLAAGLAHEIGNPLASMSSELEMIEAAWDPDEARASLPVLKDQVQRISRLLRELVDFGRAPGEGLEEVPPADVVDQVVRLLRHDPRSKGVELVINASGALPPVLTSRDRLLQVLLNLGLNALDAVGDGGRVVYSVHAGRDDEVVFEVEDDGPGVSIDVAGQVFDPFFTTKQPGLGTGLGLFVSERIMDQLGGRIDLRLGRERGAVFVVVLPRRGDGE